MEPFTIKLSSLYQGALIEATITCRNQEEFDDLSSRISQVLVAWAEQYHPHPDVSKRFQIGVETTQGYDPAKSGSTT